MLQEGNYDQFEDEVCKVFQTKKGQTMKYFRFFISGDVFSKELMNSICNIAKRNSNRVNFWMYTKQYALISQFIGKIPSNLTVLISCWGDFCPSIYEGGKYAELEKHFPLAYLDDGTENTKKYMNVEKEKTIRLRLRVNAVGDVADGYILGNITPDQNQITVTGAESIIDSIDNKLQNEINIHQLYSQQKQYLLSNLFI